MKKFFMLLMLVFALGFIFTEETTLIDVNSFAGASVEDYSFEGWEIQTQSSLKTETQIKMTPKGLGVLVSLPDQKERYVSYKIVPPYSPSLNEANSGLGYIENVGEIKSIQITVEGINKADEVILYLARSMSDKIGTPYRFSKRINFIGEDSLIWENPSYIEDPSKRGTIPEPAYGDEASNLYIRAIEIRTKCDWPVSLVYIKNCKIIYDLDKTPEELERIKESEEIWGINEGIKEKTKEADLKKLQEKKEKDEYNSSLMHKEEE